MTKSFPKIRRELQPSARMSPKVDYSRKNIWLFNLLIRLMPSSKKLKNIQIENVFIPRQDGSTKLRLRIFRPKSTNGPWPVLIWMHGGGYVMGRPEQDDARCVQYIHELGITVVSVDYRCAPKHPFPAALDDCYTSLKWLASNSHELNIDANRIAVGGNSAGSGLAASLAQLIYDQKEIKLVFQLLVYPMLDDRTVLRAEIDDSQNVTWTQKSNRFGWESYLGQECGAGNVPAYSVPARRTNLSGLPPAWIGVGDLDIFHNEDVTYANRLKECGVECELVVIPGAFHGFDVFDPKVPVVKEFLDSQTAALKKYLFQ